ncbi:MAG: hypothetical protein AVDCRST_MAG50-3153 [uncultured Acidimicrobiales bacterium]|uniref:Endo-type 6-aminohexanoate oligomer hydrolase n=1 Tax=uncultured Acidimicrobiales bacterium TaxID=310071 RepID=A0A6J4J2J2_9ACTN|nr:MAG: hypothetical protein AVDCRST_MAG50-3153 [uncultured Acidimicrobiales bacterium]
MITDVSGVRVGHWTNDEAQTGCTVVLMPAGAVASGEVRGGAPGTREFALLAPERTVPGVHAVLLTGRSAFGLAAADGVVRWCEERRIGFPVGRTVVPLVVGMVLFDLTVGDPSVRPDAAAGYRACDAAEGGPVPIGRVGAGRGATFDKWRGDGSRRPGGLGTATRRHGPLVVSALVAVNALGGLHDGSEPDPPDRAGEALGNTTIGVVATNARLDKMGCFLVSQGAHDGLARALEPAHASFDGDAFVSVATGEVEARPDDVRLLAAQAVERAIRSVGQTLA